MVTISWIFSFNDSISLSGDGIIGSFNSIIVGGDVIDGIIIGGVDIVGIISSLDSMVDEIIGSITDKESGKLEKSSKITSLLSIISLKVLLFPIFYWLVLTILGIGDDVVYQKCG